MNTGGPLEVGYANAAILGALLDRLIASKVITGADAKAILDDAIATLDTLGGNVSAPGAIRIVGDLRAQMAKHGVR